MDLRKLLNYLKKLLDDNQERTGNVWVVNRIQHICNTAIHKSPIYGLFKISKCSQRDRVLQFKCLYGVSEKYVTPRNFGSGVFLCVNCDIIIIYKRDYLIGVI